MNPRADRKNLNGSRSAEGAFLTIVPTQSIGPDVLQQLSSVVECPLCNASSGEVILRAPDRFHGRRKAYAVVRCGACGLVRLADPPHPEAMPFHYGSGYHKSIENAGEAKLITRWGRQCGTIRNLKSHGSLLDIGCSSGAFLRAMKSDSWRLYGVEISPEEAERARGSTGAEIFNGDPLTAPFLPESFDVITCFHLLEHVYKPLELLERVHSWLKPGGVLYVILPNIDSWEARIFGSYWYGLELPRHLCHFSPQSLEKVALAAKLQTSRLHTLASDSFSEHSFHYLLETMLSAIGISTTPLCDGAPVSFPVKVIRKVFRMTAETAFRLTASAFGRGASIEAVFQKLS
jgi:SAM-dependent methyltransferase